MKKLLIGLILLFSTSLLSKSIPKNVFGNDDRTPMLSSELPYSAIGLIQFTIDGKEHLCTGTLIADDLVLTNSHCVLKARNSSDLASRIRFYPNYKKGAYKHMSYAYKVSHGHYQYSREYDDWAILKLQSPLGKIYGFLKWKPLQYNEIKGRELTLAGYSGKYFFKNRSAGVHKGCTVREEIRGGNFLHDCDSTAGSSGSALLLKENGKYYIVGLHFAERTGGANDGYADHFATNTGNLAMSLYNLELDLYDGIYANSSTSPEYPHIILCNRTGRNHDISFSMAYKKEDGNYVSEGYFTLKPNSCDEFRVPSKYYYGERKAMYLYSSSASNNRGGEKFCVHKSDAFKYEGKKAQKCRFSHSKQKVEFSTLMIGKGRVSSFSFH